MGKEKKIDRYVELILRANKATNIVSRQAGRDEILGHIEDSWQVAFLLDKGKVEKVLDLGSGQGFPGLPIAIRWPQLKVTLVEANLRKAVFLKRVKLELDLENVRVIRARAEVLADDEEHRERYDLVTCRAMADLDTILKLAWPLLSEKGMVVAWKSKDWIGELEKAKRFMIEHGGELVDIVNYRLREKDRALVIIGRSIEGS